MSLAEGLARYLLVQLSCFILLSHFILNTRLVEKAHHRRVPLPNLRIFEINHVLVLFSQLAILRVENDGLLKTCDCQFEL